jgi:Big-like domain-containing protein
MERRNVVRRFLLGCCVASLLAASAATSWGQAKQFTRTTIAVSPTNATAGQTITLTARVTAAAGKGTPNGQVEFDDLAATLGIASLEKADGGLTASLTLNTLAVGSHPLTARYLGNDDFAVSMSAPVMHIVKPR